MTGAAPDDGRGTAGSTPRLAAHVSTASSVRVASIAAISAFNQLFHELVSPATSEG